jgi:hypothetical protein
MDQINNSDKRRIIDFIKENDLDYILQDDGIGKFKILSYDNLQFHPYFYNEEYVLVEYNKEKDKDNSFSSSYKYFYFKNIPSMLEALKSYDDSLYKVWYYPILNSAEIGFDKNSYNENWHIGLLDDEYLIESDSHCDYIVYNNDNYKPVLKSPYYTLNEVSDINDEYLSSVDSLNFEIRPISCQEGNESYLFKLRYNNEEVLTEYINWMIVRKKGLKIFLKDLFESMKPFKK